MRGLEHLTPLYNISNKDVGSIIRILYARKTTTCQVCDIHVYVCHYMVFINCPFVTCYLVPFGIIFICNRLYIAAIIYLFSPPADLVNDDLNRYGIIPPIESTIIDVSGQRSNLDELAEDDIPGKSLGSRLLRI